MTTLTFLGLPELSKRLTKAAAQAPVVLGVALYVEANAIMAEAIPITPIEFGTLRASAHVDQPKISASGAEVTLGFGGAASDYALYVHEDPEARHEPPTQYKFLEQPALLHRATLDKRLAAHIKLVI